MTSILKKTKRDSKVVGANYGRALVIVAADNVGDLLWIYGGIIPMHLCHFRRVRNVV